MILWNILCAYKFAQIQRNGKFVADVDTTSDMARQWSVLGCNALTKPLNNTVRCENHLTARTSWLRRSYLLSEVSGNKALKHACQNCRVKIQHNTGNLSSYFGRQEQGESSAHRSANGQHSSTGLRQHKICCLYPEEIKKFGPRKRGEMWRWWKSQVSICELFSLRSLAALQLLNKSFSFIANLMTSLWVADSNLAACLLR